MVKLFKYGTVQVGRFKKGNSQFTETYITNKKMETSFLIEKQTFHPYQTWVIEKETTRRKVCHSLTSENIIRFICLFLVM